MIFELRPPVAAGPLLIGATGHDTVEALKQIGSPQIFCTTPGSRPAWGVQRPSGLFISSYFDANDDLEAIEFGRPSGKDDVVTYDGLDVFTTPAADLVTHLRRHTTVRQEENEHAFTATGLLLALWRQVSPDSPADQEGRFFDSVLVAQPGYDHRPTESEGPGQE
jgi:hypothetical protein